MEALLNQGILSTSQFVTHDLKHLESTSKLLFFHYLYECKFKICYYVCLDALLAMTCECWMVVIFTPFLWTNNTLLFTRNMLRKEMIQLLSIHQSSPRLVEMVTTIVLNINRSSPPISIVRTIHQSSSHLTEILIRVVMSLTKGCGKKIWWRKNCP